MLLTHTTGIKSKKLLNVEIQTFANLIKSTSLHENSLQSKGNVRAHSLIILSGFHFLSLFLIPSPHVLPPFPSKLIRLYFG